ncbi:hypothetical protein HDU76_003442 [Blyttiomyces sp. JEL0837]|nr:hypothetical protein HDU76_003442 [Blyttiomyces sp. JEL0837]
MDDPYCYYDESKPSKGSEGWGSSCDDGYEACGNGCMPTDSVCCKDSWGYCPWGTHCDDSHQCYQSASVASH